MGNNKHNKLKQKLENLQKSIKKSRASGPEDKFCEDSRVFDSRSLNMATKFIALIFVCISLGWIIDYFAKTSPWAMIVFIFLGFFAGIINIVLSSDVK